MAKIEMNQATVALILALFELAMKYGVPAVQSAIAAIDKEDITLADIEALKITKEPEEF